MKAKKLLVTLLVLTFVLSAFSVGFAADAAEKLPSEVVRAQALGILKGDEQGNLNLDKAITRAEALALIVRISGLEKSAELMSGQTKFADVNAAANLQWAAGYINLGVGQKIVNGYPDGTFRGSNQVTYAEMAKMILYAMNYGVTVEGGQWPAAVMGKADDLKVFDKVNALPNVPALRGDVVKMIDNSLTTNHLKQIGYGDLTQYIEDDGKTFLSKMDVTELKKVVVTEIPKVNDRLDADEIKLDGDIYTYLAEQSAEEIFGLKVDAWVNDDDEVFFVKVKTEEKDIFTDTISKDTNTKLELLVADKEYKVASDAQFYVNFEPVSVSQVDLANAYGKVVFDRGEIAFANLFAFDNNGVVTKVADEKLEYFKDSKTTRKLNLDSYDEYYLFDKNFKAAKLEDVKKGSAIFWFENDDDEVFVVVANDTVEGKLTRAKNDEVTVGGNKIKTSVVANATVSSNANDDVEKFTAGADATEDLLGEEVVVILDVNGRVRHIVGDAETVSGTVYGVVTEVFRSGRYYYADVFTKDGETIEYKFEENVDGSDLEEKLGAFLVVEFKLNSDGEIADDSLKVISEKLERTATLDSDQFDDDYDKIGSYYVTSDTILMNINEDGDPELVKWADIKGKQSKDVELIWEFDKKDLKIVVFTKELESAASDLEYAIVTSAPWRESDGWKVELDVFGEGKQEYFLEKDTDREGLGKGDLLTFKLTVKNKVKSGFSKVAKTGEVIAVDGNYVAFEKVGEEYDWIRVDKDAVVYSTDKDGKLDKKKSYSDINVGDEIKRVEEEGKIVLVLM